MSAETIIARKVIKVHMTVHNLHAQDIGMNPFLIKSV